MSDTPPVLAGRRHAWKVSGCAREIWGIALDLPVLRAAKDVDLVARFEAKMDELIRSVPDWMAGQIVDVAEELAARVRRMRPGDTPPAPAVAAGVELWGPCDDDDCLSEHIEEEGDCRRCRLPDTHPAVVRLTSAAGRQP